MPGNSTSLYSSTGSDAVVSGTNTSGLYGTTGQVTVGTTPYGNANVAAFLASYTGNLQAGNANILGNLAAAGVLTDNYYYANGQPISFAGTYGNANVAAYLPTYTGNLAGGNLAITGEITAATVTASGNITGNYILGNGSQLTGLPQSYSNANVTSLLASFGSNTISTTGNITAGYFIGDGSQLTGLPASYGNANVAAYLPTYTGNLAGGNLAIGNNANIVNDLTVGGTIYGTFSGNISGNLVVPGANTEVIFNDNGNAGASADFTFNDATNVMTVNGTANVGVLNATGNITGSYLFGNGSQLTGLPATYGNANVADFLANYGSNTIVTTGNITAGNIIGDGQFLTNLPGANVTGTVANATYAVNANAATFAGTVTTNAQPNITSVGNLTSLTVTNDALIGGNLQVNGNITYIASNVVTINDKFINVANNAANASQANGGGIGVGPIGSEYATWTFDDGNTAWDSNIEVQAPSFLATGNVTGSYIIGDGSLLSNINAGNITGAYGNANVANFLSTGFGSNSISTTGNITAALFSGNLQGKVLDNSQTGIEIIGNNNSANSTAIFGNGISILPKAESDLFIIGTGANTDIVIGGSGANANGALFIGQNPLSSSPMPTVFNSNDIYVRGNLRNDTGNITIIDNIDVTGAMVATGNITGNYFIGNGSQLTGITSSYGNANVAAYLPTYTGNLAGGNLAITGAAAVTGNITAGNVTATGTITAAYLAGDGSNVTNVLSSSTTQFPVKNLSGGTLVKGTPVYVTGTVGSTTTLEVAASLAGNAATMPCIGLLTSTLNANDQGYAIAVGTLTQISTSGLGGAGSPLYVASAGALTATRPTGATDVIQPVGTVGRFSGSTGSIEVNIWNAWSLPNLGNGNIWVGNAANFPTQQVAYGNANVAAYLPTYTGNLAGGNLAISGQATVTGNITGNYFIGNGSQLTGVTSSLSGNMTGNINGNGFHITNLANLSIANLGNLAIGTVKLTNNSGSPAGLQIDGGLQVGGVTVFNGDLVVEDGNGVNFFDADNSNYVGLKAPSTVASNIEFTLPGADGSANTFLMTNGSGAMSFQGIRGNLSGDINGANTYRALNLDQVTVKSLGNIAIGSGKIINNSAAPAQLATDCAFSVDGVLTAANGNIHIEDQRGVRFYDTDNSNFVALRGPGTVASDVTWTLPATDGTSGQVLGTYGNAQLYWTTAASGNLSGNMTGNISGIDTYQIANLTAMGVNGNINLNNLGNINFGGLRYIWQNNTRLQVTDTDLNGVLNFATGLAGQIATNGNIVTPGNISATGNVAGAFFIGNGSALTGITATANAGGSNTQVQFNDGGVFGGNANVTFNKTTGNLAMGNLVIPTGTANSTTAVYQNWIQLTNRMVGNSSTNTTYWPSRYLLGGGLGGNPGSGGSGLFSDAATADSNQRAARVYLADRYTRTDTGTRSTALAIENWVDVSGNVGSANNNSRVQGISLAMYLGGNSAGNTLGTSVSFVRNFSTQLSAGTNGNINVGNVVIENSSAVNTFNDVRLGSRMGNYVAFFSGFQNNSGNNANIGHWIGLTTGFGGNAAANNFSLVYLANTAGAVGGTGFSTTYTPNNYYFLNNTDYRSSSKAGPLQEYFDRTYTFTSTTGNVNLDWTNGTAQYLKPTGNMNLAFTGATVNSNGNLFHTVTLVVEQGTTPYTITLPAASSTVKYAGGTSTVGATANAVIMITSTAANINGSTTYLTTVSPEFV